MFSVLQPRIEQMLVWLYPSNPSVVKTGLAGGILRDSQDPGASDVIAAGGKLPTPRPMNDIFREYTGPVLIAQGALDPLNDAKSRANIFKGIRKGVTLDLLPLGHCPMDENPKMVRHTPCNAMLSYAHIDPDTSITLFAIFTLWAYDILLHLIILSSDCMSYFVSYSTSHYVPSYCIITILYLTIIFSLFYSLRWLRV